MPENINPLSDYRGIANSRPSFNDRGIWKGEDIAQTTKEQNGVSPLKEQTIFADNKPITTGTSAKADSQLDSQGTDDALFGFKLSEQLAFYKRLARATQESDKDSLAAILLNHWINGNGAEKIISNDRIKDQVKVIEQLKLYREIFLSQRQTNWDKKNKIVGIIPRLKSGEWDGKSECRLHYQGGSFDIVSTLEVQRLQFKNVLNYTNAEKIEFDLFTSLHTTSIVSDIIIVGKKTEPNKVVVSFKKWENWIEDNYNWNPRSGIIGLFTAKHLTLPNPDYGNRFQVANPVRPQSNSVKIYHVHALELERNGLAHSFNFKSEKWQTTNPDLIKDQTISY